MFASMRRFAHSRALGRLYSAFIAIGTTIPHTADSAAPLFRSTTYETNVPSPSTANTAPSLHHPWWRRSPSGGTKNQSKTATPLIHTPVISKHALGPTGRIRRRRKSARCSDHDVNGWRSERLRRMINWCLRCQSPMPPAGSSEARPRVRGATPTSPRTRPRVISASARDMCHPRAQTPDPATDAARSSMAPSGFDGDETAVRRKRRATEFRVKIPAPCPTQTMFCALRDIA